MDQLPKESSLGQKLLQQKMQLISKQCDWSMRNNEFQNIWESNIKNAHDYRDQLIIVWQQGEIADS